MSGARLTDEVRHKLCADPLAWNDITPEAFVSGGSASDDQSTCLAPRWRKINARTIEGTPRKCNPPVDALGDPAGPIRIVALPDGTISLNNTVMIHCGPAAGR